MGWLVLVPSLVFSAIQIRTSVVDQSGLKKKLTTIVQNIFQVLSDSFGLMMQMYISFGSDSTCILSACYTHITNFGDTSKLSTGEVSMYTSRIWNCFTQCHLWQRNPFHKTFGGRRVGAECELLPSKNNNHNRKFDKFDLSLAFLLLLKRRKKNASSRSYEQFFLQLRSWFLNDEKRTSVKIHILFCTIYTYIYDRMPDFKNRWYMAVRKK